MDLDFIEVRGSLMSEAADRLLDVRVTRPRQRVRGRETVLLAAQRGHRVRRIEHLLRMNRGDEGRRRQSDQEAHGGNNSHVGRYSQG
jgi:hypothetical protein